METVINPKIPYAAPIFRGFPVGGEVKIQGLVPLDSNGFKICLLCTNNEFSDIPLQIEANTINCTIILNSMLNYETSQNVVLQNIVLKSKERFEIIIQSHTTQFLILINNQICGHYPRIFQMEQPNYLAIEGQVYIEKIYSNPTPNGLKHSSRLPPPTYEEASQQSKIDYGSRPLPSPLPTDTPYPSTAPIASEVVGYQTFLVQTGTYPLQSVTTGSTHHLHTLNNRHIRRSNYKTYLGWICVAFFIIIILLAIGFSKSRQIQIHQHRHEWFHDN